MHIAVRLKAALDDAGYTVVEATPLVGCLPVSLYRKLRGEKPLWLDELDRMVKLSGRDFSFFLPSGPA